MKHLITIVFALICIGARAQVNSLGYTKKQITEYLSTINPKQNLIKSSNMPNGLVVLEYYDTDSISKAYFFRKDTCIKFSMGSKLTKLHMFVDALKADFTYIGNNQWIDHGHKYIMTFRTDNKYFLAVFEKM